MSTAVTKKTPSSQELSWESDAEKHYQNLLRYSLILTQNHSNSADAEDLVQESFSRLLKVTKTATFPREISNFQGYLRQIAKNLLRDRWYAERNHISLDDRENKFLHHQLVDTSSSEAIENRVYYEELMHSFPLKVVLRGLTEKDLTLLRMAAVEEMSHKEIAEELGENVDTVRYNLQRLYAKVRYRARKIIQENKREHGLLKRQF